MTDEQIIKYLENSKTEFHRNTLALINRQKAQIEGLQDEVIIKTEMYNKQAAELERVRKITRKQAIDESMHQLGEPEVRKFYFSPVHREKLVEVIKKSVSRRYSFYITRDLAECVADGIIKSGIFPPEILHGSEAET